MYDTLNLKRDIASRDYGVFSRSLIQYVASFFPKVLIKLYPAETRPFVLLIPRFGPFNEKYDPNFVKTFGYTRYYFEVTSKFLLSSSN